MWRSIRCTERIVERLDVPARFVLRAGGERAALRGANVARDLPEPGELVLRNHAATEARERVHERRLQRVGRIFAPAELAHAEAKDWLAILPIQIRRPRFGAPLR